MSVSGISAALKVAGASLDWGGERYKISPLARRLVVWGQAGCIHYPGSGGLWGCSGEAGGQGGEVTPPAARSGHRGGRDGRHSCGHGAVRAQAPLWGETFLLWV